MMAIFSDFCAKICEVFMDDFSVYGSSFDDCLSNLDRVLQRCEETNLVLNWEKATLWLMKALSWGIRFLREVLMLIKLKLMQLRKLLEICPRGNHV